MHDQQAMATTHELPQHDIVRALYRGFLGREPDPAGLQYWSGVLAAGGDAAALMHALMASREYSRNKLGAAATHHDLRQAVARRAAALFQRAPLTIVDIGAQALEDEQHVYAPLVAHALSCQVIGFEPLEDKLRERQQRDGSGTTRLYPDFIGDGRRHVFHINQPDATSSLLPLNHALNRDLVELSKLRTRKTVEVDTSELDQVLADTARVDFLKLDIQGFELPALRHARAVLARTSVVHCEVSFAPIYEGQALFSEVESLLREQGFYFLDFSSSCRYAYHCASGSQSRDRLGWADAVFFKHPNQLDNPQDLLVQLVIALLVYDKYSLAESLAERYDAAAGADFASLFRGAPTP
jgi:FkbM family methyltransferase